MSHSTCSRNTVQLVCQGAGRRRAAAYISGPGADYRTGNTLSPAGSEFHNRPPCRSPDDAVRLGGDTGLVVDAQQNESFHQLGFRRWRLDGDDRFIGKDRRSFRNRIDIPCKFKFPQIRQEFFIKNLFAPQEFNVRFIEVQVLYIINYIRQAAGDGKSTPVGHAAVKHIKV